MKPDIIYLEDSKVDDELDERLRELLHECFKQYGFEGFKDKRYHNEMPKHRWIIKDDERLIAHVAAHEKTFSYKDLKGQNQVIPFLGVAEVCVAKSHRKQGLVKAILKKLEHDLPEFDYAILLGDTAIYQSSDYQPVRNVYFPDVLEEAHHNVMVKCLKGNNFPTAKVIIKGQDF